MTTPWLRGLRPYLEPAPLAALFLGISSGFAFAMISGDSIRCIPLPPVFSTAISPPASSII